MRLLLIRHAHHDYIGKAVAGWQPGIGLSERGRTQAAALPARLSGVRITAIYSSPLERALETSGPLAATLGLRVEVRNGLRELHFGEFTGRTFADLETDAVWRRFNLQRADTRAPGGELMLETQSRMIAELDGIRQAHPDGIVAVFSHGDVIRAAVMHYAGMPLDFYQRIEIHPASISTIELRASGPRIVGLNQVAVF